MAALTHTVALLVANPALSSILAATLAGAPSLRVRPFESRAALMTYLRLAGADVVVLDVENAGPAAARLASEVRADAEISDQLQIIGLAASITPETRAESIAAGIDEVILKPMSPRYLVERVLVRIATRRPRSGRALRRGTDWSRFGDNVVPLFGREATPLH